MNPPLAVVDEAGVGAQRDEDVVAEEQRMKELLQHRTGGCQPGERGRC